MIAPAIKKHAIDGLREAREELLSSIPTGLTYAKIFSWYEKWLGRIQQAEGAGANIIRQNITMYIQGHNTSPHDVLHEICLRIVGLLDRNIQAIDQTETVFPVLDGLILKISDTKLSTLLKEFNAGKDAQPNSAAITFRTILMLIIQERAKRKNPSSQLANAQDLALDATINIALNDNLFDSTESRLLRQFKAGGQKDMFDIIAHKPGANALIDKPYLSDAVDLLNKLLPTIV